MNIDLNTALYLALIFSTSLAWGLFFWEQEDSRTWKRKFYESQSNYFSLKEYLELISKEYLPKDRVLMLSTCEGIPLTRKDRSSAKGSAIFFGVAEIDSLHHHEGKTAIRDIATTPLPNQCSSVKVPPLKVVMVRHVSDSKNGMPKSINNIHPNFD